jgi:hypothetical protein
MTDNSSAADCAERVNYSGRCFLCDTIVTLFAEKRLIHVLSPVRHGVERGHQQNDVKKKSPVAFEHNQKLPPKIVHRVLLAQPDGRFRYARTDVKH